MSVHLHLSGCCGPVDEVLHARTVHCRALLRPCARTLVACHFVQQLCRVFCGQHKISAGLAHKPLQAPNMGSIKDEGADQARMRAPWGSYSEDTRPTWDTQWSKNSSSLS